MITTKKEIWLQALYGNHWEDFDEELDMEVANIHLGYLKSERPSGKFRVILRTIKETILQEA